MKQFEKPSDLRTWLEKKGIDTGTWGKEGTKGVEHLWQEIMEGDASLQEDRPLRRVRVVQVMVRRGDTILVEGAQEFASEQRRDRSQPPSEKLKTGETHLEGALRCLCEELGVEKTQVTLIPSSHRRWQKRSDSPSYPGLPTRYILHAIEAVVEGLPESGFWRENRAFAAGSDPIRRHYWDWRPREASEAGFEP